MGDSVMKRSGRRGFLPVLVGVFVVHLWAWPVGATVVQPEALESGSVIVTAETAEVREGPSNTADVITVVEKGEIFLKQGRTGGWYYVKINDDAFGWISGRAVGRYQAEGSTSPYVDPDGGGYYPYYPGSYYDYRYYPWGQPSLAWEWFLYDREPRRDRSWEHERDYRRNRDRDRSPGNGRPGDDVRQREPESHRGDDSGYRSHHQSRPPAPRIRAPFMRR